MTVSVQDPFGAALDPALPTAALALDPREARRQFSGRLPGICGEQDALRVNGIRVLRHKPGRRCVIEYDLLCKHADRSRSKVQVIGKIRARRFGNEGCRLLEQLWRAGFADDSLDGISVPEPLGVIPPFRMWCQRKVPGVTADGLLAGAGGVALARRIAHAIYKVHQANVSTERGHTMLDELRILKQCLDKACALRPVWAERIHAVAEGCEKLGALVPGGEPRGIHRDFYPAQVIVHGDRLHLIDFDLYCLGDPALDVGNFVAHIAEQSLREMPDPAALLCQERALQDAYIRFGRSRFLLCGTTPTR